MVQAIINLKERHNRVLNVVKGKHGLKNKSEAVALVLDEYEKEILEPELRPEYVERIEKIMKGKHLTRKQLEEAL